MKTPVFALSLFAMLAASAGTASCAMTFPELKPEDAALVAWCGRAIACLVGLGVGYLWGRISAAHRLHLFIDDRTWPAGERRSVRIGFRVFTGTRNPGKADA